MKKLFENFKKFLSENDYAGSHRPPSPESGSPLYDITLNGSYPKDVYSFNGKRWYGIGDGSDNSAWDKVFAAKDKPMTWITVWRAVPKGVKSEYINDGDWVTIDKKYAIQHGEHALNGEYKLLKTRVLARSLFTDGNSILEWGLWYGGVNK